MTMSIAADKRVSIGRGAEGGVGLLAGVVSCGIMMGIVFLQ
jgi:tetrahydromethanopterin S-methyltransferase subunit F